MKLNNKKGISLMVLVITIAVMIILAAAIILSLQSSGIIGRANEAKASSDMSNKKEAATLALAEYELLKQNGELSGNKTATEYVQERLNAQKLDGSNVAIDEKGNIIIGSGVKAMIANVPLGAIVNGYKLTEKIYETDGSEHSGMLYDDWGNSLSSVVGKKQTLITNTELTWKYIGIDEKGNMLIAADMPTSIPTTSKLELGYQGGYLYGPYMLNLVCDKLYTTELGTARSINIDDVNNLLEYTGTKGGYTDLAYIEETTEEALTIEKISEKLGGIQFSNVKTPDGVNTWEALSKYKANWYYILKSSDYINNEAGKDLVYNSQSYWLASQVVSAHFGGSTFGFSLRIVNDSLVTCSAYLFTHTGSNSSVAFAIRPVIELNPDVQFVYDSTTNTCTLS